MTRTWGFLVTLVQRALGCPAGCRASGESVVSVHVPGLLSTLTNSRNSAPPLKHPVLFLLNLLLLWLLVLVAAFLLTSLFLLWLLVLVP